MALFQSENELFGAENVVQFWIFGLLDDPFTLKKFYAPVLSGPWHRPCTVYGIDEVSEKDFS